MRITYSDRGVSWLETSVVLVRWIPGLSFSYLPCYVYSLARSFAGSRYSKLMPVSFFLGPYGSSKLAAGAPYVPVVTLKLPDGTSRE